MIMIMPKQALVLVTVLLTVLTLARNVHSRPVTLSYRNDAGPAPGMTSPTRRTNASPTEAQAPGRYSLKTTRGSHVSRSGRNINIFTSMRVPGKNPGVDTFSGMDACSWDLYRC
ncbi:hypothetical protein PCASD_13703 [Puccinia coronata f. sp. avenae]|nr:hypothetical protein PCASD_13703 [Puccinia coronata f. sp. avenae]